MQSSPVQSPRGVPEISVYVHPLEQLTPGVRVFSILDFLILGSYYIRSIFCLISIKRINHIVK